MKVEELDKITCCTGAIPTEIKSNLKQNVKEVGMTGFNRLTTPTWNKCKSVQKCSYLPLLVTLSQKVIGIRDFFYTKDIAYGV